MTGLVLTVEDLTVQFGGVIAVNGASLDLEPRQIRGLIGPNGAGKSTLFNAVSGLVPATGGRVRLNGEDISALPAHARSSKGIGRTFQSVQLIASRTVLENVLIGLDSGINLRLSDLLPFCRNAAEAEARDRVEEVLNFLGIADILTREVQTLSFAEQRFVEIARAVVNRPILLLLDEPAAGLSPAEIERFTDTINRLRNERQISILLVEHVISLVTGLCDRVSVLDDGVLIAEGLPEQIMNDPRVQAAYLGEMEDA